MRTQPPGQITVHHQAMATEFSITIAHADARYARQAAAEAFGALDRLEGSLSAFRPDSDVARIGRLDAGESCVVHPDTCACLRTALDLECATDEAFDIAYRTRPHRAASQLLRLGDRTPVVTALDRGVVLDLGGIGKGYALDRMADVLADWDVPCALLRASRSTVLARQEPPGTGAWEVPFGAPGHLRTMTLSSSALSGSGSDVQGPHIIDPRTGQPATHHRLAFATAVTGAEADALSTAFVVMTDDAIRGFCARHPSHAAYVVRADEQSLQVLHAPLSRGTVPSSQ